MKELTPEERKAIRDAEKKPGAGFGAIPSEEVAEPAQDEADAKKRKKPGLGE